MRDYIETNNEQKLQIGWAKQSITPSLPVLLAGFDARREAKKVLDEVFVRVVIWRLHKQIYGWISYDLCAIDGLLLEQLKQSLKHLGYSMNNFLITTTHTHSAPGGVVDSTHGILKGSEGIFNLPKPSYVQFICEQTIVAIQEAINNLQNGKIQVGYDQLADIGKNRNDPSLQGNDEVVAFYLQQECGKSAIILNFACHPTVLNHTNLDISADFPGAIESFMQKQGYDFCMFLNGSCGDISTRFTRMQSGYAEVQRFGQCFQTKLCQMKEHAIAFPLQHIQVSYETISLRYKEVEEVQEAQASVTRAKAQLEEAKQAGVDATQQRILGSYIEGAQATLRYALHPPDEKEVEITIAFWQLNEELFVAVPGELFSELSNSYQRKHLHFIGYANGYVGYFADQKAYENNVYEAQSSPFRKGESERLMHMIETQIKEKTTL